MFNFNGLTEIIMSILSGGSLIGALSGMMMALINSYKAKMKINKNEIEIDGYDKEYLTSLLKSLSDETDKIDTDTGNGNGKSTNNNFRHFINYLGIQKRYYDTNLEQTRAIFYIGITLLFIGIIMISVGVIIGLTVNKPDALTLILTFSSGVLVDFLGTVFVGMHTKTLETAAAYQISISKVSNALLAKDFIDCVEDVTLHQQALIDIAKGLTQ